MSIEPKNAMKPREKTLMDGKIIKRILKVLFLGVFKLTGWKHGPTPKVTGVVIAAPHTSNWDFLFGIGTAIIEDVKIYFSIKQSWCQVPVIGSVIMWLGAIPIDRSTPGLGQSQQIAAFIQRMQGQTVYFAFTPEGTRSKVGKWKTGFYHVALECGLPLHLGKLDYSSKTAGIFHSFKPTGNKEHDIGVLLEAYSLIKGQNISNQYPAYQGEPPQLSTAGREIINAMYQSQAALTASQIAARTNFAIQESTMLEPLIKTGLVEKASNDYDEQIYSLSVPGLGLALHLSAGLIET